MMTKTMTSGISSAKARVWQRWESSWKRGLTFCITRFYCENSRSTCSQRLAAKKKKKEKTSFVSFLHRFLRFLGLDMAAWNGCSSAAKLSMLVNIPQLTIMHCTCAADLRNLGIYHFVKMGRIQVWRI